MTRHVVSVLSVFVLGLVFACSSGLQPVNPPSFIRPERVTFACVRTTKSGDRAPVPLDQCSPCNGRTAEHALYAFVTQTIRGELAAIDLKSRQVIDTRTTVPGFTFVPVGESPSAVAVPTLNAEHTYVVNVGSSDLRVLDTLALLDATGTTQPTLATLPLGQMGAAGWQDAEPVDMVLSADEQRMVIAAPRLGGLLVLEISELNRLARGEINSNDVRQTFVPLSTLGSDATVTVAAGSDRYSVTCGVSAADSQRLPARVVPANDAVPAPVALTLDRENNRVLVADSAQPFIHVVDLSTLTEVIEAGRPTLITGVPTVDVVIAPAVLAAPDDVVTERYIYAIDADQHNVLVINDRGALQSVNPPGSKTPDRIDFGGSPASSIEVIEPGFRGCHANNVTVGPRYLNGVFVAAAMTDGSIRIADVYDLDAETRCKPTSTTDDRVECSADDPCAAVHRHRPRIASAITTKRPCVVPSAKTDTNPNLPLLAAPFEAGDTSTTPRLAVLDACPNAKVPAYERVSDAEPDAAPTIAESLECASTALDGEARAPLVCVKADPWSIGAETWFAQWEGAMSNVGSGALEGDTATDDLTFMSDTLNLCSEGVVGDENEPTFMLDLGVPVADPALRARYDESIGGEDLSGVDCGLFSALRTDGTTERLTFPIRGASFDRLTLGEPEDVPAGFTPENVIAAARHCAAGMRFTFLVRSRQRYTVNGGRSRYVHRVIAGDDGTCIVDPNGDPLRQGQAIPGTIFENGSVSFQVASLNEAAGEPPRDMTITFAVQNAPAFVGVNTVIANSLDSAATVVPELRYSPLDGQLYAVDSASRGLMPISLRPLPTGVSTSNVYR